ncbi:acetyl-CoA carboxylase biotin carboxylase subunit [Amycolatopsis minnesotensis]|uniref:biotin carboxylase n=1 Tax=Amycolatopsis minnesotensis TaxID=337894 RepID=A0ABN2RLP2_9PSEU
MTDGFSTVLVANRGEIAVRVARACREMGIRVIGVRSSADPEPAVARLADRVVHIGPAAPKRSYLNGSAVIQAALMTGAEAIHPGYGFLSEDADFAAACAESGLVFIGPRPDVLHRLGDKALARTAMAAAGVPLLPGSIEPARDLVDAKRIADDIGYPAVIKAVAGGGGRGITVVRTAAEFAEAFRATTTEAQILFGDGRVYVERYLPDARHVEVQVLCDRYGNAVHLGERDCTTQRRHQKLIEETPAPGLPRELLDRMSEAAVRGVLAVGYEGAGTVEFLVDSAHEFHFLEVNCRIQVEHPVTEMVTGIDLVRQQLHIAAGGKLPFTQRDIRPRGAAIECRINAEDPDRDFAPAPGVLREFSPPTGPFVRLDTHVYPGYRIPAAYDSLIAKLIVWGADRETALKRAMFALDEFRISGDGVKTTVGYLAAVLADPAFSAQTGDLGVSR